MKKHLAPTLLLGLLLLVTGLLAYRGASTPFFLDDLDEMAHVRCMEGWADCFAGDCYDLFRPIKNLIFYAVSSLMAESALAGHVISFVLYVITCAVVLWWFRRWLGSLTWALVAVSLWALAATQVNHLTWLSSANSLVAIAGVVGALCTYDLYLEHWIQGTKGRAALYVVICLLTYWTALLAYEGAIILPGLVLLLDWLRPRASGLRSLSENPVVGPRASGFVTGKDGEAGDIAVYRRWSRTPTSRKTSRSKPDRILRQAPRPQLLIYGLLVASALSFVCLRWSIVPPQPDNAAIVTPSKFHLSLVSAYFSTAHLWTWLAPFGRQEILGTFVWGKTTTGLVLVFSWILLVFLAGLALKFRKRWPDLTLGVLWFLIAFAPMSNLIPFENGPFADYYIPLPSIGLVVIVVAVLRRLVQRWQASQPGTFRRLAYTVAIASLLSWRGASAAEAFQWLDTWNNPEKLYYQSTLLRPFSFRARANLAPYLMQRGLYAEAEALARQCVEQAPWTPMHFGLLADIQRARGNPESARDNYLEVIKLTPTDRHARYSLATLSEQELQDEVTAIKEYDGLLQLDWHPYSARAALNLARIYTRQGKHARTIQTLERALLKHHSSAELQKELSIARAQASTSKDKEDRIPRG